MATLSITTPYKSGTLSSIGTGANGANTRLNTSGITWAVGDVGRHIYFTNGNALHESRKIIAQGANYCDIEFAFGTFPLLDQSGENTLSSSPSAGNALGVSYYLDNIDNGVSLKKLTDTSFQQPAGEGISIGVNVMIYDKEKNLEIDSDRFNLDGVLQIGDITPTGYAINGGNITDRATTIEGGWAYNNNAISDADDAGSFRFYGGNIISVGNCFWRLYRDTGTTFSHIFDTTITGNFGMRIGAGSKALFAKMRLRDNAFWAGPFTTKSPIGLLDNITVNNSENVVFWSVRFGGTTTIQNVRFDTETINTSAIMLAGTLDPNRTLTLKDILIDDIEALETRGVPLVATTGGVAATGTKFDLRNSLVATIANSSGIYQDGWRMRLTNNAGTELYNGTNSGGYFSQVTVLYGTKTVNSLGDLPVDFSDLITYFPYPYRLRKYGFQEINAVWDGKSTSQVDWREPATVPVVANEATAAGYSSLFSINWSTRVITVTGAGATPQRCTTTRSMQRHRVGIFSMTN